jgi:hypothetical protein
MKGVPESSVKFEFAKVHVGHERIEYRYVLFLTVNMQCVSRHVLTYRGEYPR